MMTWKQVLHSKDMELFERASRLGVKFELDGSKVMVDNLWYLPISSVDKTSLSDLYEDAKLKCGILKRIISILENESDDRCSNITKEVESKASGMTVTPMEVEVNSDRYWIDASNVTVTPGTQVDYLCNNCVKKASGDERYTVTEDVQPTSETCFWCKKRPVNNELTKVLSSYSVNPYGKG